MWSRRKKQKKKRGSGPFGIRLHVFFKKKAGLTSKEEGADRGSGWEGNTRQRKEKVDFTHCGVVIDGEIDTGWRERG